MKTLIIFLSLLLSVKADLLDGDFYIYLINNVLGPATSTFDPPALIYVATLHTNAAYNSISAYREKTVGYYSNIPRRPVSERTTRNKNIAIAYALLGCARKLLPFTVPQLTSIYTSVGLDVNDNSLDLTTPIGIGNYAAKTVLEARENDGMNFLGNANGRKYNKKAYEDYTNYVPKNTAYNLKYPSLWQPNIEQIGYGTFFVQQHIFPQYGLVQPYALKNVEDFNSPPPEASLSPDSIKYKKQADEIIKASKNLNDYRKMVAEHFDNKEMSLFRTVTHLAPKYNMQQDDIIIFDFFTHVALFDAGIVVWKEKIKHNTVRPFSAIRYLYGDEKIKAWGGPGMGTVNDIKGKEWKSYIRTAAHTEYPSGSACFCSSMFTFLEKYFNTTEFGYFSVKPKGSSSIEPNITPSVDVTVGPFATFSDYINACADSRVWGGVHFRASVEEGKRLCRPIGEIAYNFAFKLLNGL